jgi:hypothetical protein
MFAVDAGVTRITAVSGSRWFFLHRTIMGTIESCRACVGSGEAAGSNE